MCLIAIDFFKIEFKAWTLDITSLPRTIKAGSRVAL